MISGIPTLISAYDPDFQQRMPVSPEEAANEPSVRKRAKDLPSGVRDLLDTLLLACGAGEPIDLRFRESIDAVGEDLWLQGFLLPQVQPSRGATLDPRYYAASCRLTPALRRRRPLEEVLNPPEQEILPGLPPSDAQWDAIVYTARLERDPPQLTKEGRMRKDTAERLVRGLGEDRARWELAGRYARATGLVRPAQGQLLGFPEATPRALADPISVLEPEDIPAGRVLLRLVHNEWLKMSELLHALRTHCRQVLHSPVEDRYASALSQPYDEENWEKIEATALRRVSEVMVRTRVWDAQMDSKGPSFVRCAQAEQRLGTGFTLTPDLDILVAPGELRLQDYGRLCRLAPYQEGDRVHRHKLTRNGIGADLSAGHNDCLDFLRGLSRTGLPDTVTQTLTGWMRNVARVTLFTGVNLVERQGELARVSEVPSGARVIDYGDREPPSATFTMVEGEIRVPVGEDALTVRAVLNRVAQTKDTTPEYHAYRLDPQRLDNPEQTLETLRKFHIEDDLPGEMEVAVLAAQGLPDCTLEPALVVHVPMEAAQALARDRLAGPLLDRMVAPAQFLVSRKNLGLLQERLAELGVNLDLNEGD